MHIFYCNGPTDFDLIGKPLMFVNDKWIREQDVLRPWQLITDIIPTFNRGFIGRESNTDSLLEEVEWKLNMDIITGAKTCC